MTTIAIRDNNGLECSPSCLMTFRGNQETVPLCSNDLTMMPTSHPTAHPTSSPTAVHSSLSCYLRCQNCITSARPFRGYSGIASVWQCKALCDTSVFCKTIQYNALLSTCYFYGGNALVSLAFESREETAFNGGDQFKRYSCNDTGENVILLKFDIISVKLML